jgi:DNA-binding NarL/FixJ family response regulator
MKRAPLIELSADERSMLERLAASRTAAVRLAQRAQIVLLAATGLSNKEIAARMAINPNTVVCWRGRFARNRFAGIAAR